MSPKPALPPSLLRSWLKPLASAWAVWSSALCLQKHTLSDLQEPHTVKFSICFRDLRQLHFEGGGKHPCTIHKSLFCFLIASWSRQIGLIFWTCWISCYILLWFDLNHINIQQSEQTLRTWNSTVWVSLHFKLSFSQTVPSWTGAHCLQS